MWTTGVLINIHTAGQPKLDCLGSSFCAHECTGPMEFANVLKVDNAEGDTTWRGEARDPVCRSTCLIAEEVHIQDVNIFGS